MATNGVSTETSAKTEPKTEADNGAGDAPERTPDHAKLLENKLTVEVANKLDDIFKTGIYRMLMFRPVEYRFVYVRLYAVGKLTIADLDERAFEALKEFPTEGALAVLNQFVESNLDHVSNKSAYLCGMMKTHKQKQKLSTSNSTPSTPKGPDEEKIKVKITFFREVRMFRSPNCVFELGYTRTNRLFVRRNDRTKKVWWSASWLGRR